MSLQSYLQEQRKRVDARLTQLVPPETQIPSAIHRAMRYSLFAGGKRIRPIFCFEAARVIAGELNPALSQDVEAVSCALEMVHTYSLIHDDLPALDNDDFRRGKPTCHKAFGEANAILAGDALLTLPFEVLASLPHTPAEVKAALVAELARAAGTVNGMIAGQVLDLEATNNGATKDSLTPELVEMIHRSKTAALFRASVCMGGIAARANEQQLAALCRFGENAGLAFQIADDILDVESSTEALGKTAGKDATQKKVTYPAVHGMQRSKEIAAGLIATANQAVEPFGDRASRLKELAHFVVARKA
ncbi:MAG: polyprenyl synthetase family protein [Acidobacteria bacterium]|nr:polyprenyl synthetase family protein [Acidobacteriota bacterium]